MFDLTDSVVVAGNGRSVARIAPGRLTPEDRIVRTNNFFFEPYYFLGRRVDLAFMGGDPRVAPFMLETLMRARHLYDLQAWSAQDPRVLRAARQRLPGAPVPMRYADRFIETEVARWMRHYQRCPTTGTYALLLAHALGARHILLAGFDLYHAPPRYPFEPGAHHKALLGHDLNQRRHDTHLHNPDLDRRIITFLNDRDDVTLLRSCDDTVLDDMLDLAPRRRGAVIVPQPKPLPRDWAPRTGLYPIALLKLLRRVRRWTQARPRSV